MQIKLQIEQNKIFNKKINNNQENYINYIQIKIKKNQMKLVCTLKKLYIFVKQYLGKGLLIYQQVKSQKEQLRLMKKIIKQGKVISIVLMKQYEQKFQNQINQQQKILNKLQYSFATKFFFLENISQVFFYIILQIIIFNFKIILHNFQQQIIQYELKIQLNQQFISNLPKQILSKLYHWLQRDFLRHIILIQLFMFYKMLRNLKILKIQYRRFYQIIYKSNRLPQVIIRNQV